MLIECDRAMMKHLLRTWAKCRLRPQGVSLAHERPRLIALQGGVCPVCKGQRGPLVNDGKATHIDHAITVNIFADKVFQGELTFDQAYTQLWADSNIRAVHRDCNYDLARATKKGETQWL